MVWEKKERGGRGENVTTKGVWGVVLGTYSCFWFTSWENGADFITFFIILKKIGWVHQLSFEKCGFNRVHLRGGDFEWSDDGKEKQKR